MTPVTPALSDSSYGSVTRTGRGQYTYTPPATRDAAERTITFQYRAVDGEGASSAALATVTVRVPGATTAPVLPFVAADDLFELPEDGSVTGDVKTNDDLQGQSLADLSFLNTDPTVGTLSFDTATGTFTYTTPGQFVTVAGSIVTVTPTNIARLDNDEVVDLTIDYAVSDGFGAGVPNRLTLRIVGLDNGLGRLAGAYADTLSGKYNNHFGTQRDGDAACLTCHLPGRIFVDVDEVSECVQSPPVFNRYGEFLCLARANYPGSQPLESLAPRLSDAEPLFAPRAAATGVLEVGESAEPGTSVGVPLSLASAGLTLAGAASEIVSYLIVNQGAPDTRDPSGQFTVDPGGQVRVSSRLSPGLYSFSVLPVNDAGQVNGAGQPRPGIPGFYPSEERNQTVVSVRVVEERVQTRDDRASTVGSHCAPRARSTSRS